MLRNKAFFSRKRFVVMIFILACLAGIMIARLLYLATVDHDFLLHKSLVQAVRIRTIPANRGVIFDRNDVPLAVSAPIDNVVFDNKVLAQNSSSWALLADNKALGLSYETIKHLVLSDPNNRYLIVKKNLSPQLAATIENLNVPGVYIERNQQSYFPQGAAFSQLIGFTDVNDEGQSALELAFNNEIKATYGKQQVTESAIGQTLSVNQLLKEAKDGKDIYLSIDGRLQYIAYQAIAQEVQSTSADSGSVVVLDPRTGEVLAAASYPSFNPNSIADRAGRNVNDRAITSAYEPGSTMKIVPIVAALVSDLYTPNTPINTNPGFYMLDGHKIRDDSNYGLLTVTGVITKSSNVGASKIALSLPREEVYRTYQNFGFGKPPAPFYPGAASGRLYDMTKVGDFQFATMAFGYSISASLLQMARVYAAIANEGIMEPISFVKLNGPPQGRRIISSKVAKEMVNIFKTVVAPNGGGTGFLANVPGYVVAGKTGTAHQAAPGGYYASRYNAFFVGIIPADHPRLIIAVVVSNPSGYYNSFGGVSSAPVFAKIASQAMHLLGVRPDTTNINVQFFQNQQHNLQQLVEA